MQLMSAGENVVMTILYTEVNMEKGICQQKEEVLGVYIFDITS